MFNSSPFNAHAINEAVDTGSIRVHEDATVTEEITVISVISVTDTATGTDAVIAAEGYFQIDSGSGSEEVTITAGIPAIDTAVGSETLGIHVVVNITDTCTGADALGVHSTVTIADTIASSEAIDQLARTINILETGSAVERVTPNFSTISLEANRLSPDTYLELFDFDASILLDRNGNAGTISYFTNTPTGGGMTPLVWRTNNYYPLPFEISGVESRGDGTAMARPTIAISNVNQFLLAAVLSLGDLVGMKVTRWRTFYKFTDSGTEANINMHYPVDEWIVTRKIAHSKTGISFEMSNALDRPGLRLPRKQILTDQGFPGVSKVRLR